MLEIHFDRLSLGRCCHFAIDKEKNIFELRYCVVRSYEDYEYKTRKFKDLKELIKYALDMYLDCKEYRTLLRLYMDF